MYNFFAIGVFFWLVYGVQKKDYALIAANSITMMLALIILLFKKFNLKNE